jgi:hypothetical protein
VTVARVSDGVAEEVAKLKEERAQRIGLPTLELWPGRVAQIRGETPM